MDATAFQRACALEPHAAEHKLHHLLALNRRAFELHRPNILSLSGMSSSLAHRIDDAELRQMVLDRVARGGRLILVDEGLHLPCDVGFKPESSEGPAAPVSGSTWAGDSSRWTQEKKLESMHPELRPLVQAVIDGRWFWKDEAAQNGYWKALGEEATKQNLYWGGVWKKRVHGTWVPAPDWAHVQLVPNDRLHRLKEESGL